MTGCWRTRNRQPACRRLEFSAPLLRLPFSDAATARARLEKLLQVLPGSSFYLLLVFSHISCLQVANLLKKKSVFERKASDHFPLAWDGMLPMSIKETKPEFVERELLWQHPRIARKEVVERWTILDMGGEQRLRLHLCAYHLHLHLVVDTVDKGGEQLSV